MDEDEFLSTVPADGARPIFYLSAALARGDCTDARYWLERMCSASSEAEHELNLGRFSPEARRAA